MINIMLSIRGKEMVDSNSFLNSELLIEKKYHEEISGYVGKSDHERNPFNRFVDAWWLSLCIGVKNDTLVEIGSNSVKFNEGSILSRDPWRITILELVAISKLGEKSLFEPRKIIDMANNFANAGFHIILDELRGNQDPTLALFISNTLE